MDRVKKIALALVAVLALGAVGAGIVSAQTSDDGTATPAPDSATPTAEQAAPTDEEAAPEATPDGEKTDDGRGCPKHDAADESKESTSTSTTTA